MDSFSPSAGEASGYASAGGGPVRRVLLVGGMGSGKSRVGELLARRMGWGFRDFDREVEERVGLPIPEIFRQHGEAFFREVEGGVGEALLQEEGVVLASGGGWPAEPGRMERLPAGTLSVWLRASAGEILRRIAGEGARRPLLAGEDPSRRARELLAGREPFYRRAHVALDTEGRAPDELAADIETLVRKMNPGARPRTTPGGLPRKSGS